MEGGYQRSNLWRGYYEKKSETIKQIWVGDVDMLPDPKSTDDKK